MFKLFDSEFFKDGDGQKSMSRLLVFLAFVVSTPILWIDHSVEALSVFLGAFVINYAAGKAADIFKKGNRNVDDPDEVLETDTDSTYSSTRKKRRLL